MTNIRNATASHLTPDYWDDPIVRRNAKASRNSTPLFIIRAAILDCLRFASMHRALGEFTAARSEIHRAREWRLSTAAKFLP